MYYFQYDMYDTKGRFLELKNEADTELAKAAVPVGANPTFL